MWSCKNENALASHSLYSSVELFEVIAKHSHNVMHIGKYINNSVEITNITKKITHCASEQYGLRYLSGSRIKVIFVRATTVMLFVCECFGISVSRGNFNQRALLTVALLSFIKCVDGVVTYLG